MKNKKNSLIFDWMIYIKVIERKSFTAAAKDLCVSVATVSKVIAKLEDIFATRLISRNAHKFEVTTAGHIAYEKSLAICETYHNLLTGLDDRGEIKGELRLSAPGLLCDSIISNWIIEYTSSNPGAIIHLFALETGSFRSDSPEFDDLVIKSGYLESPDLIQRKLNSVDFGIYASTEYLKNHKEIMHPDELNGHSFLRLSHPSLRNPVRLHNGNLDTQLNIQDSRELHSNNIRSLLHMTMKERGICLAIPCWMVRELETNNVLSRVLPQWHLSPLPVYMVWRYRKHHSRLFSDFSEFIENKWNNFFSPSSHCTENGKAILLKP